MGASALGLILTSGSAASEENVCTSWIVLLLAVRRWSAFRISVAKVKMPSTKPIAPRACQPSNRFSRIQRRNAEAFRCTRPTSPSRDVGAFVLAET